MTEKLYDKDAYIKEFTATVMGCEKTESGYVITLDKTAFFPEGGGQKSDKGYIENAAVSDVQEVNGEILHYADSPVSVGQTVSCVLDFSRRFSFMQNHSGEHIVSGLVFKNFELNNVGFHLGEDFCTVDFDGELTREKLDFIEDAANAAVTENREIKAYYPDKDTLSRMSYRSKKEIDGDIRIVEIDGVDVCACCAPHVEKTGEIGIIKILDSEKMRGGTRIILKCGKTALLDYREKYRNTAIIGNMLSVKQEETAAAVERLAEKLDALNRRNTELKHKTADLIITAAKQNDGLFFMTDFDMKEMQSLADGLHKTHGGLKAVFTEADGGFNFAICGEAEETDRFFARFKENFSVRGGGRNGMVCGFVSADKKEIEGFFEE